MPVIAGRWPGRAELDIGRVLGSMNSEADPTNRQTLRRKEHARYWVVWRSEGCLELRRLATRATISVIPDDCALRSHAAEPE